MWFARARACVCVCVCVCVSVCVCVCVCEELDKDLLRIPEGKIEYLEEQENIILKWIFKNMRCVLFTSGLVV